MDRASNSCFVLERGARRQLKMQKMIWLISTRRRRKCGSPQCVLRISSKENMRFGMKKQKAFVQLHGAILRFYCGRRAANRKFSSKSLNVSAFRWRWHAAGSIKAQKFSI